MKLISYASSSGNFGDDLNKWLWPKIFNETFFDDDKTAFLGIGSILISNSDYIEEAEKCNFKIVFGTGVRSISQFFNFDSTWDICFLRGPFSSYIMTGNFSNYISDSAYYIALLSNYRELVANKKKYEVSVIPYYNSVDNFDWESCCEKMGWNLIKPTGHNVEDFIMQVSESKYVISEAMHGAIVADILRVPWQRLKYRAHIFEGEVVSEFKWNDWLYSINIKNNIPIMFTPKRKTFLYKYVTILRYRRKNREKFMNLLRKFHNKTNYSLSTDATMSDITDKLIDKKEYIINKYL